VFCGLQGIARTHQTKNAASLPPWQLSRNYYTVQAYKTKIGIHITVILPVVLYGCETWSVTPREEQRLRVFENRVLRRIFGPKRDEATGEWRRLHNEELNDLYSLRNIIRVIESRIMRWTEHVARMGGKERCLQDFGGET
jgi:hypothetical protein